MIKKVIKEQLQDKQQRINYIKSLHDIYLNLVMIKANKATRDIIAKLIDENTDKLIQQVKEEL